MDDLEKFVNNNRDRFYSDEPQVDLWQHIGAKISRKKKRYYLRYPVAAAFIGGMLLCSIFFLTLRNNRKVERNSNNTKLKSEPYMSWEADSLALAIQSQQAILITLKNYDAPLYSQFASDFEALQNDNQKLLKEYELSPNSQVFLQLILNNLLAQANLLKRQLEVLNAIKNS